MRVTSRVFQATPVTPYVVEKLNKGGSMCKDLRKQEISPTIQSAVKTSKMMMSKTCEYLRILGPIFLNKRYSNSTIKLTVGAKRIESSVKA